MGLSFEQPEWLWGLLAIVPLCLVALTGFGSMSRWRRATAALARAALTVLIVAMLAGAQSVRETERLAVVGVVDLSGSVRRFGDFPPGDDIESFARRYFTDRLENRGADDLLGLVVFDGRTATVATPSRATVLDRSLSMLPIEGTDLAGALRHAAALVPPDASGRLVLVSDGNATGADPVEVAALLGTGARAEDAGGDRPAIPVDVLPVGVRVDDEVIVERLDAPPRAGAGATVPLRVQLRATGRSTGTLRLLREGEPVAVDAEGSMGRRVTLDRGRAVEVLEVPLAAGQLSRFEVIYEPDADPRTGMLVGDRTLENNRAEAFTISPGESRVLLVDGVGQGSSEGAGAILARTLRRGGLKVEMVAPAGMPRDLLGLQAFDLVMLQNVPADALADGVMDHLVSYVRELGGGVVVVGGPETLGAGGWRGSAIEPILPVQLNLPEKLVVPEAAIVLVLDNSGSMRRGVLGSSRSQQEVANESAARAIESLDPGDMVGVIAFNNSPGVVVDLGPAANKQWIADATRGIMSGGGTNLPPALEIARDQLLAVEAKNKHIIVLSDGQSQGADRLAGIARSIRDSGIRISSIAVGDGADLATLEQIATLGEGAFYHVVNPSVLPNVFLKAVRVVRSPLVREQPFDPLIVDSASPLVGGLGAVPRLGGLVLTQARSEPTITYAMATPEGEPVLAHWAVGLGQVAVFTSDAHDWARRWLDWEGYRSLWTRTARLMSRSTGGETGELLVRREGDRLSIVYDATDDEGRAIDLLTVPATVFGPGGEAERVRLRQTGPGRYSASVPAMRGGNYLVSARPRLGATQLPPLLSGATVARNAEYARLGTDRRTLERIAEASGGRVLDADAPVDLFDRSRIEPRRTRTPLWPVLLAWTLGVFLLDVGTRRIAWDRLIGERGDEMELARIASTAGERLSALRGAAKGKRSAAAGGKAQALSDADAERLRREARARRHQQQEEELRRLRARGAPGGGSEAKSGGADAKAGEDPKATDGEPESGLLAAKRRARQRFEERGDG
jgi:Ca-activated chloride channel family protein